MFAACPCAQIFPEPEAPKPAAAEAAAAPAATEAAAAPATGAPVTSAVRGPSCFDVMMLRACA